MEVESSIPKTNFNGDFNQVVILITDREGTTVFGIMGDREGHELLWHRDDSNEMWLYLDPNKGVIQFNDLAEARTYIANDLQDSYSDLGDRYVAFTVQLA